MPYCSIQDLLKEMSSEDLSKLTGDPTGININEIRTEAAIASADALINAYLYGKFNTPLTDGGAADYSNRNFSCYFQSKFILL